MKTIRIRRGLDLPLRGAPRPVIGAAPLVRSVAVLGRDLPGVRPRLLVGEGDVVRLGQPLLEDRRRPAIRCTSPGSGVVTTIARGRRRVLQSIVVTLDGEAESSLEVHARPAPGTLRHEDVVEGLLASGLWTALRQRPFGGVPDPDDPPRALFVTAMDTQPLAPALDVIVDAEAHLFRAGLEALTRLRIPRVYVCRAPGARVPGDDVRGVEVVEFAGPHPAGLPGTHIHHLEPVAPGRTAWHVGAQDVIAIGALFTTGRLRVERVVALSGPCVLDPCLVRARVGASVGDLLAGRLQPGPARVVSGSVLSGHRAEGPLAWLGRTHDQVCVLPDGEHAERPPPAAGGLLRPRRPFTPTTASNGRPSVFWPLESLERLLPRGFLVAALLRALLVGDDERAVGLGCLGLVEEDLALATYLCPGKLDHGRTLRAALRRIEKGA